MSRKVAATGLSEGDFEYVPAVDLKPGDVIKAGDLIRIKVMDIVDETSIGFKGPVVDDPNREVVVVVNRTDKVCAKLVPRVSPQFLSQLADL